MPNIEQTKSFKLTYDREVDAAYIYIADIAPGEVANTVTYDDMPTSVHGDVNLDFDRNGKLLGIEILGASKILPSNMLMVPTD